MRSAQATVVLAGMVLASCVSGGSEPEPPGTAGVSPTVAPGTETSPLDISGRVTLFAADPSDNAGTLATGDFNGDGFTDVLFAAAFADGPDNQRPDAGEAHVFLGPFQQGETRDAAAGEQDATIYGADDGDQAGRSAAAGDVNGDGVDDIVLGAPFGDGPEEDRPDAGEVHIVFGSQHLGRDLRTVDLREDTDLLLYGRDAEDFAGFTVTVADLNGDASADLVAAAFWADGPDRDRPNAGEVYVVYGSDRRAGAIDVAKDEQDVTAYGAAADHRLGESMAAGDVNGDGLDDLVLAAPFAPGTGGAPAAGQTYVIYSPSPPQIDLSGDQQDVVIYGIDEGDQLGHAAAIGDVDADGAHDVLLTAVSADGENNTVNLAGEGALVLGGTPSAAIDVAAGGAKTLIYGADSVDRLGRSAAVGDIDGDGRADLLLGAPGADGRGEAFSDSGEIYVVVDAAKAAEVLRLPSGALVHIGDDTDDRLASEVYGGPPILTVDANGDSVDEILVAAPLGDGPDERREDCGEAYLLFVERL